MLSIVYIMDKQTQQTHLQAVQDPPLLKGFVSEAEPSEMHQFWQSSEREAVQGEPALVSPHWETQIENLTFQTGKRHFNSSISQK